MVGANEALNSHTQPGIAGMRRGWQALVDFLVGGEERRICLCRLCGVMHVHTPRSRVGISTLSTMRALAA